ncbi:hypothetical protein QA584_10910 [Anaerocolumna sp. AGMB13025]|uniref:hypothetical protein n=1 Tax=Anaerocolumna sp. AGMB13025 TaxID=3039116 RepID=UPI00241FE400|nr:hypothetical protein [Anaerocolumna sp. AGMB13025]WFR59573.1 hypothetical protein QA584_10910 [Anaerocolumna sp. AGMB13025]
MKRWEEFILEFYEMISSEERLVYQPIIEALVELDYTPIRKRTKGFILSFNNLAHNRVIARLGVREGTGKAFFGLRFSSCIKYSDKFASVIRDRILSSNNRLAKCGDCGYCKGDKFVYTYTFPNGESKDACGAFVLDIPEVTISDVSEIRKLIAEQHEYFMKYALYVPK